MKGGACWSCSAKAICVLTVWRLLKGALGLGRGGPSKPFEVRGYGLSYGWDKVFIGIEEKSSVPRIQNLVSGMGKLVIWPGMSLLKGGYSYSPGLLQSGRDKTLLYKL